MMRIISILTILTLIIPISSCRLTYILHAASGQFRLLFHSIPVEEALKANSLNAEQRDHLRLVAQIKNFGEKELGLKKTQNYQTVYLKSRQAPVFTISASPKDRLTRITWWFPVVGKMPYLGFFDLESARAEKKRLVEKDLDVVISRGEAYSTLGWFKDPVTLNLLEGTIGDLVETILHEMTHTTLYVKGEGEFNEGLAVITGMKGAVLFLERTYGPSHPLTIEAQKSIEDERLFSSFLTSLFEKLERLYNSPISFQEKLTGREKIFFKSLEKFDRLKNGLQTERFIHFGSRKLNNASLMSIGLYHHRFHDFEAVLKEQGGSIRQTLSFFQNLAKEGGDILETAKDRLKR